MTFLSQVLTSLYTIRESNAALIGGNDVFSPETNDKSGPIQSSHLSVVYEIVGLRLVPIPSIIFRNSSLETSRH